MIRLVVFDIDGVITDGTVIVDVNGTEQKKINLKDVDAIFELHREGFRLAAITGERQRLFGISKTDFHGITFTVEQRKRRKSCKR